MERPSLRLISKLRYACLNSPRHISSATIPPAINSTQAYPLPTIYDDPVPAPLARPALPHGISKSDKPFSHFLTDRYSRQHDYLRISITERCNLRCAYCMPEEGVALSPPSHLLTTPEITYLSSLFVSQGVTKIRLTGGEPTIRRDILPLMHSIGDLRRRGLRELCITTNGIVLHRKLDSMAEAGLTGVNLSLDTLDPLQFQIMTRRKGFEEVLKSMDRILEMNRLGAGIKLKINCVVMRNINDKDIIPFVELGKKKDLEVRFIEYMPFQGNKWNKGKMLSYKEMLGIIESKYPELRKVPDHQNNTSKTYQIPGFMGKIGFITSMTHNFCGSCNRLRITSDGNLKVCLFGNAEVSLRDLIRKGNGGQPIDEQAMEALKHSKLAHGQGLINKEGNPDTDEREQELLQVIGQAVKRKKEKHAGMGQLENMKNRPMILIDASTRDTTSTQTPRTRHLLGIPPSWSELPLVPLFPGLTTHRLGTLLSFPYIPSTISPSRLYSNSPAQPLPSVVATATPSIRSQSLSTTTSPGRTPSPLLETPFLPRETSSPPEETPSSLTGAPSSLPHLTATSTVHVIPISHKSITARSALAIGHVTFSNPNPLTLVRGHALQKGDVLAVARIAAITAAKKTSDWIPLCHSGVPVEGIKVRVEGVDGHDAAEKTTPSASSSPVTHKQPEHPSSQRIDSTAEKVADDEGDGETQVQQYEQTLFATPLPPYGGVRISVRVDTTAKTGVEMEALVGVVGAGLTIVDMCKGVDRGLVLEGVRVVGKKGGRSGSWGVWGGKD